MRERLWGRKTLFWSMVAQALAFNASCACAVKALQAAGRKCSASTAGFCKARARFPEALLDRILSLTAGFAACASPPARRVLHIDGVSFTLADTPENRVRYDAPSGQAQGCGFPVLSALAWLRQLGADMVCRLHQRRKLDLAKAARNAKGDWTLVWRKGARGAKSPVDAARFERLPDELAVRVVKSVEQRKGFRSKQIFIATTLLDCRLHPADLIRDLYLGRWKIEESLRDIKDSMNYGFIRSRSPASVMKTLKTALVAHNLIRATADTAARRHRVDRQRVSFKGAATSFRLFLAHRLVGGTSLGIANFRRLLLCVAADLVDARPGRREPRAVKKRAKPYPLLACDRHEYQEVPHKSRYRKASESA